jgi:dTDP-glucose 4,6-dehydratase
LGWQPQSSFEEGLRQTIDWYLENKEWLDHVTNGEYQRYYDIQYDNR